MTIRQLVGDCRAVLRTLDAESVQTCVSSPPYYGLRSYIADGDPLKSLEIGLEPTPELFISRLVEVFREVRRVLRPDGTLWCNLGDSYAGSGKGPSNSLQPEASQLNKGKRNTAQFANGQAPTSWISTPPGLKAKDLMMMPARVAMALQADGWWLRSMIPWLKRNSMPESVTDRPATAVEYAFLLSKSKTYYWDADAVRVAQSENNHGLKAARERGYSDPGSRPKEAAHGSGTRANGSFHASKPAVLLPSGRNRRNTDWFMESWQGLMLDEHDDPLALVVNPQPFRGSHFATFPPKLVEPMVKASTRPGDVVLDPFGGAGTVGLVADRLGRDAVLIDLKADYADMASSRIVGDSPMFVELEGGTAGVSPEPVKDKQAALGKRTYSGFNARWDANEAAR